MKRKYVDEDNRSTCSNSSQKHSKRSSRCSSPATAAHFPENIPANEKHQRMEEEPEPLTEKSHQQQRAYTDECLRKMFDLRGLFNPAHFCTFMENRGKVCVICLLLFSRAVYTHTNIVLKYE